MSSDADSGTNSDSNSGTESNSNSDSESEFDSNSDTSNLVGTKNSEILEKYFTCGICSDILYKPYTLICQHTFCKDCLIHSKPVNHNNNYDEDIVYPAKSKRSCPVCGLSFILHPTNQNYLLTTYLDTLIPEDLRLKLSREKLKESLELEVRNELKAEMFKALYEESLTQKNLGNQGNQGNQGIQGNPFNVVYQHGHAVPVNNYSWKAWLQDTVSFFGKVAPVLFACPVITGIIYHVLTGKHLLAST